MRTQRTKLYGRTCTSDDHHQYGRTYIVGPSVVVVVVVDSGENPYG